MNIFQPPRNMNFLRAVASPRGEKTQVIINSILKKRKPPTLMKELGAILS
mgnify:FL=1